MMSEKNLKDAETIANETITNYEEFINPAMAKLFRFMGLGTVEWEAEGTKIKDVFGQTFIDCLGGYGVYSLGHRHPKVIEAVKRQLDQTPLGSKVLFNQSAGKLAALLAEVTPGDLRYSFFCNSGAEAVEGALKLARLHTGRKGIIATSNGFHGKTLGALSATGRRAYREPCEPLLPDFFHVPFGDINAFKATVSENIAAVIIEPIQGEGGIILPPKSYFPEMRKICDENGTLLIMDEVQTGLGRTGKLFAAEHYNVVPDIMTLAKALGGGVMPIGAFIARPEIWKVFIENPFIHTSTFGGNPLACSAAVAAIKAIIEDELPLQAAEKGDYFIAMLADLWNKYPKVIREVRGKGLLIGLELTKEGLGGVLMSELIQDGIIVAYTLNNQKVIRIEPPLIISYDEIKTVLASLDKALEVANSVADEF